MQTLTLEITNNNALKTLHALEEKQFINILDRFVLNSPSLPGKKISLTAFKNWIANAEDNPVVDIKEAKSRWANKRKQLIKFTR